MHLPSGTGLQIMTILAFSFILLSISSLYYLFTQMDLSRMSEFSNKLELTENSPDDKKTSSLTDGDGEDDTPKRRYLTQYRRIVLMLTVGIITILVYLILVFSNAPSWLEWVGMLIVLVLLGPILQYGDEIRRSRYDRLSLMVTLVLVLATGLNLAVYASNQYADEDIYKGPARIIDYQDDSYNNAEGDTVTRTDLMVAWGGEWGCPHNPGQYCEAAVPGALCDSSFYGARRKLQDENADGNDGGDAAAQDGAEDAADANNGNAAQDGAEDAADANNEDAAATDDGAAMEGGDGGEESYQQLQEDYQALEEQYEELQDKYDALQEMNQNLQNDLDAYMEAYDELEDEYTYYWDDDYYSDGYWDENDWTSVWGDYQCTEMFEYDLEGSTYEEDVKPGEDGWPFLNVYGNCDTCEAFIVDFYSTEHFQEISSYKQAAKHYAWASIFGSIITIVLAMKHKFSPQADNEIELLPSAGHGAMA